MDLRDTANMQADMPQTTGEQPRGLPSDPFDRGEPQRPATYGTLRLQPVVLGPPPGQVDVTAADDINLEDFRDKPRTGLFAGIIAAVAVLVTVGMAYWTLRPSDDAARPPAIASAPVPPQPPVTAAPEASPPEAVPATILPAPGAPPSIPAVDMAHVDNDLVAPSTEGLTPARRIATIRIVVENDREVSAPR